MNFWKLATVVLGAALASCQPSIQKDLRTRTGGQGSKTLQAEVAINAEGGGFGLTAIPTFQAITRAVGRVPGCVDTLTDLTVDELQLSIEVGPNCQAEVFVLDELSLTVVGFTGEVRLLQGATTFLNAEFGSWSLSGFTVQQRQSEVSKSTAIAVNAAVSTIANTVTIIGEENCFNLVTFHAEDKIIVELQGLFNEQSVVTTNAEFNYEGIVDRLAQANLATWSIAVPQNSGQFLLQSQLIWQNAEALEVGCTVEANIDVTINTNFTQSAAAVVDSCPLDEFLCDTTQQGYCDWQRLDSVQLPGVIAAGTCLLNTLAEGVTPELILSADAILIP